MSDEIQQPDPHRQIVQNTEIDQKWADWLAPTRRSLLYGAGAAAVGVVLGEAHGEGADGNSDFRPIVPPPDTGKSPWGYETYKRPAADHRALAAAQQFGPHDPAAPQYRRSAVGSSLLHAMGEPFPAGERLCVEAPGRKVRRRSRRFCPTRRRP